MLELLELSSNNVRRNKGSERGRVYFRVGRAAISQGNKMAAQDLFVGRSGGDGVVR